MVSELVKTRSNPGRDARLHFYRDRAGLEVDALFPPGPRYLPLEIKSGRTLHGDSFNLESAVRLVVRGLLTTDYADYADYVDSNGFKRILWKNLSI